MGKVDQRKTHCRKVVNLSCFRNRRILKAQNGSDGGANECTGKTGKDLHLKIPMGTLIKDPKTGEVLCDFTEAGQTWKICQGGKGGATGPDASACGARR